MNDAPSHRPLDGQVLAALPLGFCLFDAGQVLVLVNDAFCRALGLPGEILDVGMSLADSMRVLAYQGCFGPGDPEQQALDAAHGAQDRRRLRRRRADGHAWELTLTPLPDGGCLATAVEMSARLGQRDVADKLQARLASTFEALRQGIAVFDARRTLLLSNSRFAELLGLPADAVRAGLAFGELERLLDAVADVEGFEGIVAPAQALAGQLAPESAAPQRCLLADGRLIQIGAGRVADGGWTVTVSDISPASIVEDDVRRRGKLLAAILERLPHGLCVFGADRRVGMFNRAFTQIMQEAAVRVGDPWSALIGRLEAAGEYGPGPGERGSAMARQLLGLDLRQAQAWRRRRPNGTAIDVRLTPLPDGGMVCVVTDVTGAVRDEPDGALLPQDMKEMLASIRHGIILWDREGRLIACNPIAAGLVGLPESLLTRGRTQHEILLAMADKGALGAPDEAGPRVRALLSRDIDRPYVEELAATGGQLLEISSDPVRGNGFIWTCTDVTERHLALDELRRARTAAEAASLAKSSFLATMSHELRTPLNAVIGFSETLTKEAGSREVDPARVTEFATAINDAGRHLLNLINNILDVARIEAGRFDLAAERIDVPSLVAASVRQANASARAAEVGLHADIPTNLPVLRGDERRLRQVMAHLLSNAIKFTDAGGSVRVAAARQDPAAGGDLLISVADTGIGIPEADLDRVFEPFTQIDGGLARRAMGSGLGLYFGRALVTAHGGELTLASRPGKGTTAVIRLPRSRLIEAAPDQAGAPAE